jgi:hypothetical protein
MGHSWSHRCLCGDHLRDAHRENDRVRGVTRAAIALVLFDVSYVAQFVDYTRIDSGGNAMACYDDAGPQRYASVGLQDSAFVYVTFGIAYQVSDRLRVGATVMDVVSKVTTRVARAF